MTKKSFLFQKNPRWGWFFAESPLRTALLFSTISILLLILPAWILKMPADGGEQFITKKPNWSLMYPIVIPVLFGGMVCLCKEMKRALIRLLKTKVILPQNGKTRTSLFQVVSDRLSEQSRRLLLFSITATLIIIAVDTWDVWVGYCNGNFDRGADWETAFRYWPGKFRFHNDNDYIKQQDLVFTIIAYSFEAAASLISFYWIGKYWQFLRCLAEIIRGRNSNYKFSPLIHDPKHRFGLYPLATLFNGFLMLTVVFQLYGLYHRLQQHEHYRRNQSGMQYLVSLFEDDKKGSENVTKETEEKKEPKLSLAGLYKLKNQDYSFDTLRHTSTMLPLILTTIPFVVISFLPLGVIRVTVKKYCNKEYDKNIRALNDAINSGRKEEAEIYKLRQAALEKANIWPNGDLPGWGFLCLIVVLSIGAWLPPLLVYLVTCGGLLWGWKLVQKLRSGKPETD
jgi:hypothetical protein